MSQTDSACLPELEILLRAGDRENLEGKVRLNDG